MYLWNFNFIIFILSFTLVIGVLSIIFLYFIRLLQTCGNDSLTFSDQSLNFIKSHPLMDWAVPAFGGQPVLVQSNLE